MDRVPDPIKGTDERRGVGFRQDDSEDIASKTRGQIDVPDTFPDDRGNCYIYRGGHGYQAKTSYWSSPG